MTDVTFHFNVIDRLDYACRLTRKAVAQGARLMVTADPLLLESFDTALWTFSATAFISHCHIKDSASIRRQSPVWLAEEPGDESRPDWVLLNLGQKVFQQSPQFARLIEVVTSESTEISLARRRWRQYVEWGLTPAGHDTQVVLT